MGNSYVRFEAFPFPMVHETLRVHLMHEFSKKFERGMGTGVLPFQPSQKNERNEDQLEMRFLSKEIIQRKCTENRIRK